MSGTDPQNIAEILAALKATTSLGKHLDHAQIWEHWEAIVGPEFAPRSHPLKVRKRILTVAILNPVWMLKFSYDKREILSKINSLLTTEAIEDIYLTLPPNEDLPKPPDTPKSPEKTG